MLIGYLAHLILKSSSSSIIHLAPYPTRRGYRTSCLEIAIIWLRRVKVTPTPGFVVKTSTTEAGFYTLPNPSPPPPSTRHAVPGGLKVFINVAYSADIPPPPTSNLPKEEEDEIISRAIEGDVECTYFVPVVVSDGRADKDKAGKPSLVFDAFLNPAIKSRMTKDMNFRSFVLEIILSHVESPPLTTQARSLVLSRTLAMPNIRFKGVPVAREMDVPDFPSGMTGMTEASISTSKPLIEELVIPSQSESKPPKSILKKSSSAAGSTVTDADAHTKTESDGRLESPAWYWDSNGSRPKEKLIIELPKLNRSDHLKSVLSVSEDILTLRTPTYFLQLPLDGSLGADLEQVRAEWHIREGRIIVHFQH